MAFSRGRSLALAGLLAVLVLSSGCAYMRDRGHDALNIFDIGFTVTKEPHFGIYAGFNSLLALGYMDMPNGWLLGLGHTHFGALDMRYHGGGMLFEGYESQGYDDDFDASDPASPRERGMGLGMLYSHTPRTIPEALQCNKIVHVGWIGFDLNCKIGGLLNFLVGWTTFRLDRWECFGSGKAKYLAEPPPIR
ncbi:MAG: hypothetical protein ACLQVA_16535 [Candidatus Brocadiia bacterium]